MVVVVVAAVFMICTSERLVVAETLECLLRFAASALFKDAKDVLTLILVCEKSLWRCFIVSAVKKLTLCLHVLKIAESSRAVDPYIRQVDVGGADLPCKLNPTQTSFNTNNKLPRKY